MDKTDELILNLKEQGKSLRETGRELGLSHMAIKKRLDKLGATYSVVVSPVIEPDDTPIEADAFSEPEKVLSDDDVQHVWVSDFPAIERAYSELDEKIKAIEELVREELDLPENKRLAFYTSGGWKIEQRQVLTLTTS